MAKHESHDAGHGPAEAGHAKPRYDDINTPLIIMVGIISAILTYLSVVVVQGMTYQMDMNLIRQRSYGMQFEKSAQAIEAQKEMLHPDPARQRPGIDQAMSETVAQFARPGQ